MRFVSTNLVNMTDGYYRIVGFSAPRYVSGYRFKSEITNTKPLHFFEKTKDDQWAHTFADLAGFSDGTLTGNIELLPADFDPSSIFRFEKATDNGVERYTLSTQGLNVQAAVGSTSMSTADGTKLRLDDIGGAAVTLRTLSTEPAGAWDTEVVNTIKTNYLNSNGDSYGLTLTADNELFETSDIQDTKWLLQPVGIHEDWPYNEMPLRVEVQKGGVKNRDLTGDDLTAESNKDTNYYGTLYVPFDTRLGNTTDAAFTLTKDPTEWGTTTTPSRVTMASVSRLNEMGNPQFVPADWPVVVRTSQASSVKLVNQGHTEEIPNVYATRHYVNMYIPNDTPTTITGALDEIKLSGQYLEQTLTSTELGGADPSDKTIMVFGLPFVGGSSHSSHEYNENEQVGWFTNDNWAREDASGYKAHTGSYAATGTAGTVADHSQRSNKYVYHNKVYYVLNDNYSAPSKFNVAIFDDEGDWDEEDDKPIKESVGNKNVPWPCRVYDLQGRRIAEHESPETLLINHPSLEPGVYIFGDRKVIVK